ncbi:EAL domain-containing protein [Erythrobacter sp.]|uniref:putative bifunctional diguanylate cyclase/phosphodiesterase n=1 Tax=Erythrobacter sp. TaxID=1042 RepID=UPI00312019FE
MLGLGKFEHELIRQTPLSLLALTRHTIEPHEEEWFARCRADYLRSFPTTLLELVRSALLLALVGPLTGIAYSLFVTIGCGAFLLAQISLRRTEARPGADQAAALETRRRVFALRVGWWLCALAGGLALAPAPNVAAIAALGIVMMVIDGLRAMSLPYLALAASFSGGIVTAGGLLLRGGQDATPYLLMILVIAAFLHWSIFNLYYLFATRRIRTRRLAEAKETVQLLLNQYDDDGSDWLYELDAEGRILNPSARFSAACGLAAEELAGITLAMLFHEGNHRRTLANQLEQIEPFRNLVVPLTVDNAERWWSISGRPVEHRRGQQACWRGFISDITQAKAAEARIAFMAHYDQLTGLPNRTLFNATLEREMARSPEPGRTGLLFVDLDHFKEINDGYGHETGDAVLGEVGRRLELAIRPGDMVARLGGDEFAILLADLPSCGVGLEIADQILRAMREPVLLEGHLLPLGASIGAAFAPRDGLTGEELLRSADLAMYNAKLRGRDGISIFDNSMLDELQNRRDLALGLRNAVEQGEMELHYQPLVEISTGATVGYEALLRWHHPERGLVSPTEFIPIAEETGLIVPIGEWIIRTALHDAAQWPEHQTVAVNVSPVQLRDDRLIRLIANALATSGVAAQRLELEITESLLIQNTDEVLALLHDLRRLGVRISLDDFGTGYSSLTYLHYFPFDKIKIDQSFVEGLADREDCQAIIQSVIALADDLHMVTTAEGVETKRQLTALRDLGCIQVQGFYFSQALPARELGNSPAAALAGTEVEEGKVLRIARRGSGVKPVQYRRSPQARGQRVKGA